MEANSVFDSDVDMEFLADLKSLTANEFDELLATTATHQFRDIFLNSIPDFDAKPKKQRSIKRELKRFSKKCDKYERGMQQLTVILEEQNKMLQSAALQLSQSKKNIDLRVSQLKINNMMIDYEYQIEKQTSEISEVHKKIQKSFNLIYEKLNDEKINLISKMEKIDDDIRMVNFVKKQSQEVVEELMKATEFLQNEQ